MIAIGLVFMLIGAGLALFSGLAFWVAWGVAVERWKAAAPRIPEPDEVIWLNAVVPGVCAALLSPFFVAVGYSLC